MDSNFYVGTETGRGRNLIYPKGLLESKVIKKKDHFILKMKWSFFFCRDGRI